MNISSNQGTRKSFSKSANASLDALTVSANQSVKKGFNLSSNASGDGLDRSAALSSRKAPLLASGSAWNGTNLSDAPFGADDPFGGLFSAFGTDVFGGQAHFKRRVPYSVR